MENLQIILSLAGTTLSLFVASIIFLCKMIKGFIAKKKLKNNYVLLDAVAPLMEIAESFFFIQRRRKKGVCFNKGKSVCNRKRYKIRCKANYRGN